MRRVIADQYAFLWRSLRRLGVADAALEDAAQKVLIVMARRLHEIPAGAERSFVFSAAVRVASDARRTARRQREDLMDDAPEEIASPLPSPEDVASERSDRRVLAEALEAIPLEFRSVFILFELEELTTAEIAAMLDLPMGTVASRLRRARELFKATIEAMQHDGSRKPEARRGAVRRTPGTDASPPERAASNRRGDKP
jgi:RNA polymerase sigma-70 factor (ECF subfamily)